MEQRETDTDQEGHQRLVSSFNLCITKQYVDQNAFIRTPLSEPVYQNAFIRTRISESVYQDAFTRTCLAKRVY